MEKQGSKFKDSQTKWKQIINCKEVDQMERVDSKTNQSQRGKSNGKRKEINQMESLEVNPTQRGKSNAKR